MPHFEEVKNHEQSNYHTTIYSRNKQDSNQNLNKLQTVLYLFYSYTHISFNNKLRKTKWLLFMFYKVVIVFAFSFFKNIIITRKTFFLLTRFIFYPIYYFFAINDQIKILNS